MISVARRNTRDLARIKPSQTPWIAIRTSRMLQNTKVSLELTLREDFPIDRLRIELLRRSPCGQAAVEEEEKRGNYKSESRPLPREPHPTAFDRHTVWLEVCGAGQLIWRHAIMARVLSSSPKASSTPSHPRMLRFALALQLALPAIQSADEPADTGAVAGFFDAIEIVVPGSIDEDLLRARSLLDPAISAGSLLRSARFGSAAGGVPLQPGIRLIAPRLRTDWNSDLPFSLNNGALWSGRGSNAQLSAGALARVGPLVIVLAPELVYRQNDDFQTFTRPPVGPEADRHELASPFHMPPLSLDMPQRPGFDAATHLIAGQSSVTVESGPLAVGASTENLWWGPGLRNGIVLSSNAPGIPHLFIRTLRPIAVAIGTLEARWILGRLEESPYFDFDPTNDYRSLSAIALTFSPGVEPDLTIGFARAVYAPSSGPGVPVRAALDVFRNVGRPGSAPGDSLLTPAPDQLFSLFARWHFSRAGLETYFEWGRYEQPANFRDLLLMPGHSQGYSVGAQWARSLSDAITMRLHAEATYLEPSPSYRVRPVGDWYTSRSVPQGYTHQGRVIGASIGPGGSSQWLAADWLGPRWTAGIVAGRIRWENQAQYTYPDEYRFADATVFAGMRAGIGIGYLQANAQLISGLRYNYLFQAQPRSPIHHRGVDIRNHSITLTLSART